jgi:hypothetical protein
MSRVVVVFFVGLVVGVVAVPALPVPRRIVRMLGVGAQGL